MLCFAGQNVSRNMDGEACPAGGSRTVSAAPGQFSDRPRSATDSSGVIFTISTFENWGTASFSHLQLSDLKDVSHESFVFPSSTFTFGEKSRTKASFSQFLLPSTSSLHLDTAMLGNDWKTNCLCTFRLRKVNQFSNIFRNQWNANIIYIYIYIAIYNLTICIIIYIYIYIYFYFFIFWDLLGIKPYVINQIWFLQKNKGCFFGAQWES